jgi:hypothetical protein
MLHICNYVITCEQLVQEGKVRTLRGGAVPNTTSPLETYATRWPVFIIRLIAAPKALLL